MGLFSAIFGNSENLYFPGCYSSAFLENKIENYRKILKKLKIEFSTGNEFMCCGGFLEENGYDLQLRKIARENLANLKSSGIKKIITNCPLCLSMFKDYKNLMPDYDIESEYILSLILNALLSKTSAIKHYYYEPICYYDSCYLPRYCNLADSLRELLKLLGYQLVELPKNKEETLCCGSCGNLPLANPELADKIANKMIETLKRKKITRVVTADPRAYIHLSSAALKAGDEIKIVEVSDLICDALGIDKS